MDRCWVPAAETTRWAAGLSTSRRIATCGAVLLFRPSHALPLPSNRQTRRYRLRPLPGASRARQNSGRDRLRARPSPERASAPPPLRNLLWLVRSPRDPSNTACRRSKDPRGGMRSRGLRDAKNVSVQHKEKSDVFAHKMHFWRGGQLAPRQKLLILVSVVIGSPTGKPPCEFRIFFDQKLRRAFGPNEDRVRLEPDVRVGLNVVGYLLDATHRVQLRRASGVRAAHQSIV